LHNLNKLRTSLEHFKALNSSLGGSY